MRWITVLSLLIVCSVCLSVTQASIDDCCLRYVRILNRRIQRHVVQYTRQNVDGGCNLPAIIFFTKRNRIYCTNPAAEWVEKLMKRVDERHRRNKSGEKP